MSDLREILLQAFAEEAVGLMTSLHEAVDNYNSTDVATERHSALGVIRRIAHTLKGAARSVESPEIELLCSTLESRCREWEKTADPYLPPSDFSKVEQARDLLQRLVDGSETGDTPLEGDELQDLIDGLELLEVSVAPDRSIEAVFAVETLNEPERKKWRALLNMLVEILKKASQGDSKEHAKKGFKVAYALLGLARSLENSKLDELLDACIQLFRRCARTGEALPRESLGQAAQTLSAVADQVPLPDDGEMDEIIAALKDGEAAHPKAESSEVSEEPVEAVKPTEPVEEEKPEAVEAPRPTALRPMPRSTAELLQRAEELSVVKLASVAQAAQLHRLRRSMADQIQGLEGSSATILSLKRRISERPDSEVSELIKSLSAAQQSLKDLEQQLRTAANRSLSTHTSTRALVDRVRDLAVSQFTSPAEGFVGFCETYVREMAPSGSSLKVSVDSLELHPRVSDVLLFSAQCLMDNIVDHAKPTKKDGLSIEVTLKGESDGQVTFVVADNGTELKSSSGRLKSLKSLFVNESGSSLTRLHSEVGALGGTVQASFDPSSGLKIALRLPRTLRVQRSILFSTGESVYALGLTEVNQVIRLKGVDLSSARSSGIVNWGGQGWPVRELGKADQDSETAVALLVECEGLRTALLADRLIGDFELPLRPLPSAYAPSQAVAGVGVTGDGAVALLLRANYLVGLEEKPDIPEVPAKLPQRDPKILLVDDSMTSRMLLKAMLTNAGYDIVQAADGQIAFDTLEKAKGDFDVIVSDIEMPNLNGLEFAVKAKSHDEFKSIPFILISTLDTPDDRKRGMETGADAYVIKGSLRQNALVETIEKILGRS